MRTFQNEKMIEWNKVNYDMGNQRVIILSCRFNFLGTYKSQEGHHNFGQNELYIRGRVAHWNNWLLRQLWNLQNSDAEVSSPSARTDPLPMHQAQFCFSCQIRYWPRWCEELIYRRTASKMMLASVPSGALHYYNSISNLRRVVINAHNNWPIQFPLKVYSTSP